jgi:hypothetical protein
MLAIPAYAATSFIPTDDAFIATDLANTPAGRMISGLNFGNHPTLLSGYSVNISGMGEAAFYVTLIKFDLSSLQGEIITSANLSIYVKEVTSNVTAVLLVYGVAENGWSEKDVTYITAPNFTEPIAVLQVSRPGLYVINVTSLAKAGPFSIALVPRVMGVSEAIVVISSKESRFPPVLKVEHHPDYMIYLPYAIVAIVAALVALIILRVNLFKKPSKPSKHEV